MLKMQRKQDTGQQPASIDDIISMLEKAVTKKSRIVKELAIKKVGEWIQELVSQYSYLGSLKKKLSDALGKLTHLNFEQKQKAWELVEQFLKPESKQKSVTLSS
jgi:23S rRNA A1618 N6-methylase RlmF